MFKCGLIILVLAFVASEDLQILQDLTKKVTSIYKQPKSFTSDLLLNTTETYLTHLTKMEEILKSSASESLHLKKQFLAIKKGNLAQHLDKIPVAELSENYGWNEDTLDTFMITMCKTQRVWKNILETLKKDNKTSPGLEDLKLNYVQ